MTNAAFRVGAYADSPAATAKVMGNGQGAVGTSRS